MYKLIKTSKLAGFLMMNGYKLLRMNDDKKNPIYKIYIFRNDEGIENAIDQYKENYGRKED